MRLWFCETPSHHLGGGGGGGGGERAAASSDGHFMEPYTYLAFLLHLFFSSLLFI